MSLENYCVGDYQTMSVSDKIEFMHRVHKDEISLWDEDGDDNEIWKDYHTVQDELWERAETLDCEDILHIMRIFDDNCFELSWQLILSKIVARNCISNGENRVVFYLEHMQEIPLDGRFHGCYLIIKWFISNDFSTFKKAIQGQTVEVKKLVMQTLDKVEEYQTEKEEIRRLCGMVG